jgi:ureidoglycolate dehydrogenase (NAD+)
MDLSVEQATDLTIRALTPCGVSDAHARIVADHLIEAALCGHEFSSLPRILAIADELRAKSPPCTIRVTREDGAFAHIDGGDHLAYVVSLIAIDKAIDICARTGIAVVTANNTWFSGRCAYYVERAARRGYVALHTTNTTARVAPFGGSERLMGTNPFAIAFPSEDDPIVIDIGTSAITWGDVVLARAKGESLPAGVAVDPSGRVTLDPKAALDGAFMPWGGQRGSALAIAVQLLGVLAGSQVVVNDAADFGLFFVVIDPARITQAADFKRQVSAMRTTIEANRPLPDVSRVRVPGDGSLQRRKRNANTIRLDDKVYARILALAHGE